MLDPDYLEQAGEKVAGVYRQIEADMLDYLVAKMIEGDVGGQRAQTAIHRLAQNSAAPLMDIFGKYGKAIDAAVKLEITEALRLSNTDDLSRIKRGLGVDLPAITTRQVAATVAGAKEILERQNLLMAESARNAFLQQSLWAVTQVNTGTMTTEKALHAAVRRLEGDGISLITYRNTTTGMQSVQNKVDVAVRRHIRTQIAQDGMRLTELLMDEADVDLVEVSSHGGARPSHAKWEGRVYSRNGDKIINGVRYRDFKSACNWGDVADGIGGANCRHSYAAWFPGMERSYYPNPDHPSGKTNEEVYGLTQKQRTGERA
ncbi:MAG: phage minor capsid protein, partial [Gordonibacter sp.]|uniref:phage minor capsid protein n=1 Tax=Gordonibacter sp. TaxID=1968902 RepID=UPI002FCAF4BA